MGGKARILVLQKWGSNDRATPPPAILKNPAVRTEHFFVLVGSAHLAHDSCFPMSTHTSPGSGGGAGGPPNSGSAARSYRWEAACGGPPGFPDSWDHNRKKEKDPRPFTGLKYALLFTLFILSVSFQKPNSVDVRHHSIFFNLWIKFQMLDFEFHIFPRQGIHLYCLWHHPARICPA